MTAARCLLCLTLLLSACGGEPAPPDPARPPAAAPGDLSGTPYAAAPASELAPAAADTPPAAPDNSPPMLRVLSEGGVEENGELVVDAYQKDLVYLGVSLETEAGSPLAQRPVAIRASGQTKVIRGAEATDADGYLEFQLLAANQGRESVIVEAAGLTQRFVLNVKPNQQLEWIKQAEAKGLTSWDLLMQADLTIDQNTVRASFPAPLQTLGGKTVKIAGFMLPLDATPEQRHFLLSANPPSCYFHMPGGPSTVVEVFSEQAIPGSFEPLVIEGRLELVPESTFGVVYKLQQAKVVTL
ncbi:MAG TPA: DUF3299 domain-containing protein [Nevskiaceae bacterium]|nr:DUF3299 domain-containing protein [Nevskiaceae bacterium]